MRIRDLALLCIPLTLIPQAFAKAMQRSVPEPSAQEGQAALATEPASPKTPSHSRQVDEFPLTARIDLVYHGPLPMFGSEGGEPIPREDITCKDDADPFSCSINGVPVALDKVIAVAAIGGATYTMVQSGIRRLTQPNQNEDQVTEMRLRDNLSNGAYRCRWGDRGLELLDETKHPLEIDPKGNKNTLVYGLNKSVSLVRYFAVRDVRSTQ